jgi:hypothetical protein
MSMAVREAMSEVYVTKMNKKQQKSSLLTHGWEDLETLHEWHQLVDWLRWVSRYQPYLDWKTSTRYVSVLRIHGI